jgi:hypothetical protein
MPKVEEMASPAPAAVDSSKFGMHRRGKCLACGHLVRTAITPFEPSVGNKPHQRHECEMPREDRVNQSGSMAVVRNYSIRLIRARANTHDEVRPTPISRARRGPRLRDVETCGVRNRGRLRRRVGDTGSEPHVRTRPIAYLLHWLGIPYTAHQTQHREDKVSAPVRRRVNALWHAPRVPPVIKP